MMFLGNGSLSSGPARQKRPESTMQQRPQVEEASVRIFEYQKKTAGAENTRKLSRCSPDALRKVTLPRCYRKGMDGFYTIQRAKLLWAHTAAKKAEKEAMLDDQRSEASDSTADTQSHLGAEREQEQEQEHLLEPFARYLSAKLDRLVTGIFYPTRGGGWERFDPDQGPLPFLDGMVLVLCFEGEEPDEHELPALGRMRSTWACLPSCMMMR